MYIPVPTKKLLSLQKCVLLKKIEVEKVQNWNGTKTNISCITNIEVYRTIA